MRTSKKDFKVLRRVGKGGFGVVYEAIRRSDGTKVALKVLDRTKLEEKNLYRGVNNEVEIHKSLTNPAVVKLFEKFEEDGFIYLVLEYCPNGDLHHFLKNRNDPLPEDQARELFGQVVEGVVYLHNNNIVHRDLSLNNLLLTSDMTLKISDFGLAKRLDGPQDRHITICGTPNFMSPETLKKDACGFMGDCWSLGCILYYLLTGELPFEANGVEQIMHRVRDGKFHMPTTMSVDARSLITLLLQSDPSNRVRAEEILSHSFLAPLSYPLLSGESADSGNATLDSEHSITSDFSKLHIASFNPLPTFNPLPSHGSQKNLLPSRPLNSHPALRVRARPLSSPSGPMRPPRLGTFTNSAEVCQRVKRVKPSCLNTTRLTPRVQKRKGYEIEVCPNGSICLRRKTNTTSKEFQVTGDGQNISVMTDNMTSQQSLSYSTLPERYYNDYTKLVYCVNALKSYTPKITIYSELGTAHYMENGPDPTFEVRLNDGSKLHRNTEECTWTDSNNKQYTLTQDISPGPGLPALLHSNVALCRTLHSQCIAIERCIDSIEGVVKYPLRMGLPPKQNKSFISTTTDSTSYLSQMPQSQTSSPVFRLTPNTPHALQRSPIAGTQSPQLKRSSSLNNNRAPLVHIQRAGSESPKRRQSIDESEENKENSEIDTMHMEYSAGLGWLKHLSDGTCRLECNDGSELNWEHGREILLKCDGRTHRLPVDSPTYITKTRALRRFAQQHS